MKSSSVLILAVGLGIGAALLNAHYLQTRSKDADEISFVGIKAGKTVNPGERLSAEHLDKVSIPERHVGNLQKHAVRWERRETVVGRPVSWPRKGPSLEGPALLLGVHLQTPPPQLELGENDLAWAVPVDTRSLVPSLMVPGDEVWFLGSAAPVARPTSAGSEPLPESGADGPEPVAALSPSGASGSSRIIGPFTVLALGNRLGSAEVMQAAKIRQVQENVVMVKVTMGADKRLNPEAEELLDLLQRTGSRPLGYLWRPAVEEEN